MKFPDLSEFEQNCEVCDEKLDRGGDECCETCGLEPVCENCVDDHCEGANNEIPKN